MHILRQALFLGNERPRTADNLCCGTGFESLIEERGHLTFLKHRDLQIQ